MNTTSTINFSDVFGLSSVQAGLSLGSGSPLLIVVRLINVALGFLGIITVIMILYGGMLWMFSGGDEDKLKKARSSLIGTIIGLLIILSANSIINFIIQSLSQSIGLK